MVDAAAAELHMRHKRERMVLFCNVPDTNNDGKDLQLIINLLKESAEHIDLRRLKISRLGKFDANQSRPRLLKAIFL